MAWLIDDPQRLFKQVWGNANDLAQELYSMFASKAPVVHQGSVTIEVPEGKPGLQITQSGPSSNVSIGPFQRSLPPPTPAAGPGPFSRASQIEATAGTRPAWRTESATQYLQSQTPYNQPGGQPLVDVGGVSPIGLPDQPLPGVPQPGQPGAFGVSPFQTTAQPLPTQVNPASSQYKQPLFSVDGPSLFSGPPVQFTSTPYVWNPSTVSFEPLTIPPQGPVPTEAHPWPLMAVVVGKKSGQVYNCNLFSDGFQGGPDDDIEEVLCPNVDVNETLPAGMILHLVCYDGVTFESYPPVWLS